MAGLRIAGGRTLAVGAAIGLFLPWGSGFAQNDACDDYIARHHKKDLKPISVSFINQTHHGDIPFPHQLVKIRIKNVGQEPMAGSPNAWRNIKVSVAGHVLMARIKQGLQSGGTAYVRVDVPPNTLRHCGESSILLDFDRQFGQWGCQVYSNDHRQLRTVLQGRFCRTRRLNPGGNPFLGL